MLWSLWIIYILFVEKFEAKINTNILCFKTFISFMAYFSQKLCLYLMHKTLERDHIKVCYGRYFAQIRPCCKSLTNSCFRKQGATLAIFMLCYQKIFMPKKLSQIQAEVADGQGSLPGFCIFFHQLLQFECITTIWKV